MRKLLSLAALGIVATGLLLATPATSLADGGHHRGRGSFYGKGFYPGFGGGYGRGFAPGYGDFCPDRGFYRRPPIAHPSWGHWTPGAGYHTHGHVHVPHRGHYHTYPY
jgi:hypothetical protein